MKYLEIKVNSVEEMINLGTLIGPILNKNDVLGLDGDLGSGKTMFTKGIGKALNIERVINSPTFTIMKIYDCGSNQKNITKLYHLDVYRLKDSTTDFELEEYFYLEGLTIIEWSKIIEDLLPPQTIHFNITRIDETSRLVEVKNLNKDMIDTIYYVVKEIGRASCRERV